VRVLVVGDKGDDDPGFVGERLAQVGATLVPVDRDDLPDRDSGGPADLLYLLGSARSAHDPAQAGVVAAESELVRARLDGGVPVLGICYGAQLLALALGGQVMTAPRAEVGWFEVDTDDPVLCPPGPWLQFHSDAFTPPPGVRVLGRSSGCCQGFAYEGERARALAWQFHPETTPRELGLWLDSAADFVLEHEGDPVRIAAQAAARATEARAAAHDLTDAALRWLGLQCVETLRRRAPPGRPA